VKEFKFEITITEGNDEWWEDVMRKPEHLQAEEIREVFLEELRTYDVEIKNLTPYQAAFDFGDTTTTKVEPTPEECQNKRYITNDRYWEGSYLDRARTDYSHACVDCGYTWETTTVHDWYG